MRFDSGKGWPHPVLRPPEYGDDYPNAEFEVEIDCRRDKGGVAVEMTVDFALSDPDLLRLVDEDAAEYVVLVKSTKTHFRQEFRSKETRVSANFKRAPLRSPRDQLFPSLRTAADQLQGGGLALRFRWIDV